MNKRDKELALEAGLYFATDVNWMPIIGMEYAKKFADLIRADERESIAQMFEGTPALIPFAQNDKGGCMICGFTPRLAMEAIRARGNTNG